MEFLSKSFPGGFIEAGPEMAGKKKIRQMKRRVTMTLPTGNEEASKEATQEVQIY
jgi:hypothetical protein